MNNRSVMKPSVKILVLIFGLMAPYMGFVIYRVLTHPQHPLPDWFLYTGPCYFIGSMVLATFLRKRIVGSPVLLPTEVQKAQRFSAARAARRMGSIWLVGPVVYLFSGEISREPFRSTVVMLSWVGLLSWSSFRGAKNIELKAHQHSV